MLISCPNCATQFSVPDNALGAKGRTLKCARCGHKWFETPASALGPAPPPPPPPPEPEPPQEAAPPVEPPQLETVNAEPPGLLPGFENFTFDASDFSGRDDQPAKEDLTVDSGFFDEDERMPAAVSARAPRRTPVPGAQRRRRGRGLTVLLWSVAAVLLLAGGGFVLKDQISILFPAVDTVLRQLGINETPLPGAGLVIRDEKALRYPRGTREVLEINGIIANVTDKPLDVPWLHVVLYDSAGVAVMDRMHKPKVDGLDAGATTAFRVELESPHPDAQQLVIQFITPPEG